MFSASNYEITDLRVRLENNTFQIICISYSKISVQKSYIVSTTFTITELDF